MMCSYFPFRHFAAKKQRSMRLRSGRSYKSPVHFPRTAGQRAGRSRNSPSPSPSDSDSASSFATRSSESSWSRRPSTRSTSPGGKTPPPPPRKPKTSMPDLTRVRNGRISKKWRASRFESPHALNNRGFQCFKNSALQSIFHIPVFYNYLVSTVFELLMCHNQLTFTGRFSPRM
jgi:hypothetical protein